MKGSRQFLQALRELCHKYGLEVMNVDGAEMLVFKESQFTMGDRRETMQLQVWLKVQEKDQE